MILVVLFVIAVGCNIIALRAINLRAIDFFDGIIIGMTYYLTLPMIFIMSFGVNPSGDLPINDYYPYKDYITTLIIIVSIFSLSICRVLIGHREDFVMQKQQVYLISLTVLLLYGVSAFIVFVASGIVDGGHWAHATGDMMSDNAVLFSLKFIASLTRMAAFPCLAALYFAFPNRKFSVIMIGAAVCLFDVFTTFNRITIFYYLILLIIIYRHSYKMMALISASVVLGGLTISPIFSIFRAMVGYYGYSHAGFEAAWGFAQQNYRSSGFLEQLNGVFESSNISVLNYIVYHYDSISQPFGTYFVRPLTIFVPRSLFPDRPGVFGGEVGHEILGGNVYVAINSTLLGEPYASHWALWPLFIAAMIVAYTLYYRWLGRQSRVFEYIGAFVALSMWRFDSSFGASSAAFYLMLIVGMAVMVELKGGRGSRPLLDRRYSHHDTTRRQGSTRTRGRSPLPRDRGRHQTEREADSPPP